MHTVFRRCAAAVIDRVIGRCVAVIWSACGLGGGTVIFILLVWGCGGGSVMLVGGKVMLFWYRSV